jgi:hypothetical protein
MRYPSVRRFYKTHRRLNQFADDNHSGYRDDQCVSDGVVKLKPGGKYDLTWSIGTIQRFEKLASQQTATMAFESLERDIQDMAPHIKAQWALCRERFKRITDIFLEIQQET